jgi:hypothetical protein
LRRSIQLVLLAIGLYASAALAQTPVGELYATGANVHGSIVLAGSGTIVLSGSSVSAGATAALLKLARGGEVRICPATSLTATSGKRGELTLGLGTGAIELNFDVQANADTLLTADFRLLFAGPGKFHLAAGARSNGDTCLKSLEGNAAAVIVNEQMGDATFQLRPGDAVLFRNGNISEALREPGLDCGCPAPPPLVLVQNNPPAPPPTVVTNSAPAPPVSQSPTPAPANKPPAQQPVVADLAGATVVSNETVNNAPAPVVTATNSAPEPAPKPVAHDRVINVPMSFSASEAEAVVPPASAPAAPRPVAALLNADQDTFLWAAPVVQPPGKQPAAAKPAKKNFLVRFFSALFGRHSA